MRDSRVTVWTNPTVISTNAATNGPTIDLLSYGYVGDHLYGTSLYGAGVEIIAGAVVAGSDTDGFTLTWKWQVSADGSTWVEGGHIGVIGWDDTPGYTKDGTITGTTLGLARAKLSTRLRTVKRYCRLVCTSADIEGSATVSVTAFLADGTNPYIDSGVIY